MQFWFLSLKEYVEQEETEWRQGWPKLQRFSCGPKVATPKRVIPWDSNMHQLSLVSTRTGNEILQLKSFIWEGLQKELRFYSRITQISQLPAAVVLEPESEHRLSNTSLLQIRSLSSLMLLGVLPWSKELGTARVMISYRRSKMNNRGWYFYQTGWLTHQKCLLLNRQNGWSNCYTNNYGRVECTEWGNMFSPVPFKEHRSKL